MTMTIPFMAIPQVNPGVWSAVVHTDRVYVQFAGFHWSNGTTFPISEMGSLPTEKPGTLW